MRSGPAVDDAVEVSTVDLYDPDVYEQASQHPSWSLLRRNHPLWRQDSPDGRSFWSVTRYDDVVSVVKDHRRYSSTDGTILAVLAGDSARERAINLQDPPAHRGLRLPTMRLLSTAQIAKVADTVADRVGRMYDQVGGEDEFDFVAIANQLALATVGDILGFPESEWPDVVRWTLACIAPEDPGYAQGTVAETLTAAHFNLFGLFEELIEDRRRHPADDLVTTLLQLEVDGRRLADDDVAINCYTFALGANITTPQVASQTVLALAENPDQWSLLRGDPSLIPSAVEEGARWATPVNHLLRRATSPVELHGTTVESGEFVCAWLGSANRDERVFDDPFAFDVTRSPNPHLGYGAGAHYCNGAPAARTVLGYTLRELVSRYRTVDVGGAVTHLRSNFVNGVTSLPIAVST